MASPSFLSTILRAPDIRHALESSRSQRRLATRVEPAIDSQSRRRGLLGRDGLDEGDALLIAPSSAIHTFFMRFAIDVIFAARDGRVLKIYSTLRPWRMAFAVGAFAVIELPAGTIARSDVRRGDILRFTPL